MKFPKYTILVGLLCCLGTLPASAATVAEVEPNNTVAEADAQPLTVDGSDIQVNGNLDPYDVDVYALDVQATDVLSFTINCGYQCGTGSVDSRLTIIDGSDMSIWQDNDDANGSFDPAITGVSLGKAGHIYVLVTQTGSTIDNPLTSVTYTGEAGGGAGDYQLVISGATAPVTTGGGTTSGGGDVPPVTGPAETDSGDQIINVNINPFYRGKWPRINPRGRGILPVAILSQEGFNPMDIVQSTLRFGATGEEDSLVRCRQSRRDLNRDGVPDLICYFSMRKAAFDWDSESGILTGSLQDGTGITSQAPLKMVPYKRHHHGRRGGNRRRR